MDSETVRAKMRIQVTFDKFVERDKKLCSCGAQLKKYSAFEEFCVAKLRYLKMGVNGNVLSYFKTLFTKMKTLFC